MIANEDLDTPAGVRVDPYLVDSDDDEDDTALLANTSPTCPTCQILNLRGDAVCSACKSGQSLLTRKNESTARNHKKLWKAQADYTLPDLIIDQDDPDIEQRLSR